MWLRLLAPVRTIAYLRMNGGSDGHGFIGPLAGYGGDFRRGLLQALVSLFKEGGGAGTGRRYGTCLRPRAMVLRAANVEQIDAADLRSRGHSALEPGRFALLGPSGCDQVHGTDGR